MKRSVPLGSASLDSLGTHRAAKVSCQTRRAMCLLKSRRGEKMSIEKSSRRWARFTQRCTKLLPMMMKYTLFEQPNQLSALLELGKGNPHAREAVDQDVRRDSRWVRVRDLERRE